MKNFAKYICLFLAIVGINVNVKADTFTKITSLGDLTTGKYVIVAGSDNRAMSPYRKKSVTINSWGAVAITVDETGSGGSRKYSITTNTDTIVWDVTKISDGLYSISQNGKYVNFSGESNNAQTEANDASSTRAQFTITYGSSVFTVKNKWNADRYFKYNNVNGMNTFGNWGSSGGQLIRFFKLTTEDPKYTVTLQPRGGSGGTTSVRATNGAAMPAIDLPTRAGYDFAGYFTDFEGAGTKYYNANGTSARNYDKTTTLTLYAHWTAHTYAINYFDQNSTTEFHGVFAGSYPTTRTYGNITYLVDASRTGYDFGGWYYDNPACDNESAKKTQLGGAYTVDINLYAKWTAHTTIITLDATTNGGTSNGDAIIEYGSDELIVDPEANHGGKHLNGFWSAEDGGVKVIDASGNLVANAMDYTDAEGKWAKDEEEVTLYAQYDANYTNYQTYCAREVQFRGEGYGEAGTWPEDVTNVKRGSLVAEPTAPVWAGHNFAGWYDDEACSDGHAWNFETGVVGTGDATTLYAKWSVNSTIVTALGNGGLYAGDAEYCGPTSFPYGAEVSVCGIPSRVGYTFGGYTLTPNGDDYIFDKEGASMDRAGYFEDGKWVCTAEELTVYAHWTAVQYTITYENTKGATNSNPATYTVEDEITFTALPNVTGYTFTGWSPATISAGTIGNQTVTASWTTNQHSLTWDFAGGATTSEESAYTHGTVDYGTTITAPANPTKVGYTFNGWSPTFVAETTMPDNNVTYTAQWTPITYQVSYNGNGNTGVSSSMDPTDFIYDKAKNLRKNYFTKTGCFFAGWARTADGEVVYSDQESVSNLTTTDGAIVELFAKWLQITLTAENPIKVTSTAGKTIAAAQTMVLNATGLTGTESVTISSNNSAFSFSTTMGGTKSATLEIAAVDGAITNQTIYVHYTPTATEDGTETATIVAKRTSNDAHKSGNVTATGRHLPEKFVIATKVGSAWYALTNLNTTASYGVRALVPISVNNNSNPTTATVYSTTENAMAWTLVANNATNVRYAANGDKILFTRVIDAKGLAGTSEGLRSSAGIPASGDTYTNWAWIPTTTDLVSYTLANLGAAGYSISASAAGFSMSNESAASIRFLSYTRETPKAVTWYNEQIDAQHAQNTAENGVVTLPTGANPEPCNTSLYEFYGWGEQIATTKTVAPTILNGGETALAAITYYAIFKQKGKNVWVTKCPNFYTITYKANGGTGDDVVVYSDVRGITTHNGTGFSKVGGCTLVGWNTASDGSGTFYKPNQNVTIAAEPYDVDLYAVWLGNLQVAGDVHLTTGNGIQVYTTATANLVTVSSADLTAAKKLKISYWTEDGSAEITGSARKFRVCDPENSYNVADDSQIDLTGVTTDYSKAFSISYTPTAANTTDACLIRFEATDGSNTLSTVEKVVYGRSLPSQFAIVMKNNDNGMWYALPNVLGTAAGEIVPQPINVEVDGATPTKVTYAPASVLYQAASRYEANSHRGAIRLQSVANSKYITATTTDNTSFYMPSTGDDDQQFYLNSSNLSQYLITLDPAGYAENNPTRWISMTGGRIGWFNTSYKTVYLLPVEETKSATELTVVDWKKSGDNYSIVFDVTAKNPKQPLTASINEGEFGAELTRNADRTVEVPVGVVTPDTYVKVDLKLNGTLTSTGKYRVPFIYDGGTMAQGEMTSSSYVIINSGNVSVSGTVSVKDVQVKPNACLTVTGDNKLKADRLVLRSESWVFPNLKADKDKVVVQNYYYTRRVSDGSTYYQFGMPYASSASDVVLTTGTKPAYYNGTSGQWRLKTYDAASRAESGWNETTKNWVVNPTGDVAKMTGYELWSNSNYYKEFMFRMATARLNDASPEAISLVAHEGAAATENPIHGGWNYVVSPLTYDYVVEHVDGAAFSDPSEQPKLAEMYEDGRNYYQYPVMGATIRAFSPFYYQAASAGSMTFGSDGTLSCTANYLSGASFAQRRVAEEKVDEQWLQIFYSDAAGVKDQTNVYLHPTKFTMSYQTGKDVVKMSTEGSTRPMIYTQLPYGDLAFAAVPDSVAEVKIPMAVYAAANGEMTFTLKDNDYLNRVKNVYLVDEKEGIKTDLLISNYRYDAEAGTCAGRFYIEVVFFAPSTTTEVENSYETETMKPKKVIVDDKLFIIVGEKVYDGTGKLVNK